MLNIAVCDDEAVEIEYLVSLVQQWAKVNEKSVNILRFGSAEEFLFKYEDDKSIDILLLDIQMKEMDGIRLAQKIRETDKNIQIVFITGFPDYISRGYDVSALHYLIKPVEKEKLSEVLSRASVSLRKQEKFILLSVENESVKINVKDIVFVEAFGHSSCVVCEKNQYNVKLPISDIAKMLGDGFVQCHRSYIANIGHISKITKTDVFFDSSKSIPVSRRMYSDVNSAFISFYRGNIR